MGTPMAFPGSVQTRRGAASCLLQASFAEPLSPRVGRERYAIYICAEILIMYASFMDRGPLYASLRT